MNNQSIQSSSNFARNLLASTAKRLYESANHDFQACLLAGVPIEYRTATTSDGQMRLVATTLEKVGVLRQPDGRTTVYRKANRA